MFHCPFCKTSAHSRTSRYLSDNVKQRYHQCMNIECSATFRTLESIDGIIRSPVTEPVIPLPAPAAIVNRAGAEARPVIRRNIRDHTDATESL